MPAEKSLFYYGPIYHRLFDPALAEARQVVVDLVPEGSSVLDLGCGTGQLCFDLRAAKNCRVVGVDLSLRMLQFAENASRHPDIAFLHKDATELTGIDDRQFDYATVLCLVHELPRDTRLRLLVEALRVAEHILIVDSRAPLPLNLNGLSIRLVEATFGREHYRYFKDFLAGRGIMGFLEASRLPITVLHRSSFWGDAREVVMVSSP